MVLTMRKKRTSLSDEAPAGDEVTTPAPIKEEVVRYCQRCAGVLKNGQIRLELWTCPACMAVLTGSNIEACGRCGVMAMDGIVQKFRMAIVRCPSCCTVGFRDDSEMTSDGPGWEDRLKKIAPLVFRWREMLSSEDGDQRWRGGHMNSWNEVHSLLEFEAAPESRWWYPPDQGR